MSQWLQKLYNWYKNLDNRRTPGTSSVDLIFFVLTCSILFLFSLEIYRFVNDFQHKYSAIIKKQQQTMEKQLKELEKELNESKE